MAKPRLETMPSLLHLFGDRGAECILRQVVLCREVYEHIGGPHVQHAVQNAVQAGQFGASSSPVEAERLAFAHVCCQGSFSAHDGQESAGFCRRGCRQCATEGLGQHLQTLLATPRRTRHASFATPRALIAVQVALQTLPRTSLLDKAWYPLAPNVAVLERSGTGLSSTFLFILPREGALTTWQQQIPECTVDA